jgi:hypothetical protein
MSALTSAGALLLFAVLSDRPGSASPSPGTAASPAAFVSTAVQRTLAQQTAEFTFSETIQGSGQAIPASGGGEINFTNNSMTLNIGVSFSGHSVVSSEILIGGTLYSGVPENGRVQWSRMALYQSPADITDGDPFSELSLPAQDGASVTSLGTKSIAGVSCTGYAVTPSRPAVLAWGRQEIAELGLSSAQASAALQYLESHRPPTMTVWIDPDQLMREVGINAVSASPGSSGPDGGQLVIDFTHYGVPVRISAPGSSGTAAAAV